MTCPPSDSGDGQPRRSAGPAPSGNTDLVEAYSLRERQLSAMRTIALAVGNTLDLNELLLIVMEEVTTLMEADRSTLYLMDLERGEMWSKVVQGERLLEIRLQPGEGLAGSVAQSGDTMNIPDAYSDPRFNPEVDKHTGYQTGSVLAVPVRNARGELLGVVQVLNKHRRSTFTTSDEMLLEAITAQIAVAIENATLYTQVLDHNRELRKAHDQLERKMRELDFLFEVEQAMSEAITMDDLLKAVLRRSMDLLDAEVGAVVIPDPERRELYFTTAIGGRGDQLKKVRLEWGQGIAGWVLAEGKAAMVNDPARDPRHKQVLSSWLEFSPHNLLCVPLTGDGDTLGAIEVLNKRSKRDFTNEDLRLMSLLAPRVAHVLRAARERETRERNARLVTIGQMLSSMVHDFKTPMTAIGGYVELLAASEQADERRTYGQMVFRQIDRLSAMSRELLLFAKGQTEVLLHKIYLDRFVEDVRMELSREFANARSQLEVSASYLGSAYMDDNKMQRALQNIARNAIEAMAPQGGGVFTVSFGRVGDNLEIQCRDTGPGISDEIVDRLFDSFATHGKTDGTGIGLAIVKQIVDEHHGAITFESHPGEGTTFQIQLPLQPSMGKRERA